MNVLESRKVDELGRIVLPFALREKYSIAAGTFIDICTNDQNQIVLVKREPECKICGSIENLKEIGENRVFICKSCLDEICG